MSTLKELAEKVSGLTWLEKYSNLLSLVEKQSSFIDWHYNYTILSRSFYDLKKDLYSDEEVAKKIFEIILRTDEEMRSIQYLSISVARKLRIYNLWSEAYYGNFWDSKLNEIGVTIPYLNRDKDELDYYCYSMDNLCFNNLDVDQICDFILKDQSKMIQEYFNKK